MKRSFKPFASAVVLAVFLPALGFAQGRIQGTVSNGSNSKPVARQEIRLLMPRNGTQVGTATSDASGHFAFPGTDIDPKSFYLATTEFEGASYNSAVAFDTAGAANVVLTVYDSTRSTAGISIPAARVLVGAEGSGLRVQEEYAVQNSSTPLRTYVAPGGTFTFRVPADAGTPAVSVTGLMNMQLPQTPVPGKAPGEFAVSYALKPGVTTMTVQYTRPYEASGFLLKDGASFPISQAELYVYPSSLLVEAPAFQPAGVDQKHMLEKYEAQQLARGTTGFSIRFSGAPASGPPPGMEQPGQGQQGQGQQSQEQGGGEVKIVPNSISQLTVPVLAGFLVLLLWALGVRVVKEWPKLKTQMAEEAESAKLDPKADKLLNSIADLDELFAGSKIAEQAYWKERLELKARLVAVLKKNPPTQLGSYAARQSPR
jgi:hypothetical protein